MDMEQHMSTDPLDLVLFIQYNLRKKLHSDSWLIGSLMLVLQEMRTYKNLVSPPTYVPRSCATNHAAAGGQKERKEMKRKEKDNYLITTEKQKLIPRIWNSSTREGNNDICCPFPAPEQGKCGDLAEKSNNDSRVESAKTYSTTIVFVQMFKER